MDWTKVNAQGALSKMAMVFAQQLDIICSDISE